MCPGPGSVGRQVGMGHGKALLPRYHLLFSEGRGLWKERSLDPSSILTGCVAWSFGSSCQSVPVVPILLLGKPAASGCAGPGKTSSLQVRQTWVHSFL